MAGAALSRSVRRLVVAALVAVSCLASIMAPRAVADPLPTPEYRPIRIVLSIVSQWTPQCEFDFHQGVPTEESGHCTGVWQPGTYPFGAGVGTIRWQRGAQDPDTGGDVWWVRLNATDPRWILAGDHVGGAGSGWLWPTGLTAPWGQLAPGGRIPGVTPGKRGGALDWGVVPAGAGFNGGHLIIAGYVYIYPTGTGGSAPFGS